MRHLLLFDVLADVLADDGNRRTAATPAPPRAEIVNRFSAALEKTANIGAMLPRYALQSATSRL